MKILPSKRAAQAGVAVLAAASLVAGLAASPAGAVDPLSDPPVTEPIVLIGADATAGVLDLIFQNTPNIYNVLAVPDPEGQLVPERRNDLNQVRAPQTKWIAGPTPQSGVWNKDVTPNTRVAPNGAGAALTMLKQQEANLAGNSPDLPFSQSVDIVRSSNAPRNTNTDPASFEFYAFALDSVGWASTSLSAPASLTKSQLKKIYNCEITDWSQLPGGGSGPIRRYLAQNNGPDETSSGTWNFFKSDLLDNTTLPVGAPNTSCLPFGNTQQSTATFVPDGAAGSSPSNLGLEAVDYQKAIFLFTSGVWAYQANNSANPTIDKRNGARIGAIRHGADVNEQGGTSLAPVVWDAGSRIWTLNPAVVKESNVKVNSTTPAAVYPGIRYQYLVIDDHPNTLNYDLAKSLVGFDNVDRPDPGSGALDLPTSEVSSLCNGGKVSPILSGGFQPLDRSDPSIGANAGANKAHSTCRLFRPQAP